ncbi:hypothetical protein [Stutzerimonas xanthomarina]|uniref:hypothetical protein n=1 Tax=Stutzerimonas xanthomarina TaxID=271420 RepID=UPI003AA94D4F
MFEFLANPPWWVVALVTLVLAELNRVIKRSVKRKGPVFLQSAKGRARGWFRSLRRKELVRIKAMRFDSVKINRIVIRSYAYLVLFIICGLVYLLGMLLIPEPLRQAKSGVMFWGIATALPTLFFEFAWLRTSNTADSLISHRAKIRVKGRRLT